MSKQDIPDSPKKVKLEKGKVKLSADDEIEKHLIQLFRKTDTLEDVRSVSELLNGLRDGIRPKVESRILEDRYVTKEDLFRDVRDLKISFASDKLTFYCPLVGYENGERTEEYIPESDYESITFAAQVMGSEPKEWGLVLNAAHNDYVQLEIDETYEMIRINGGPALFTTERLTDADIPDGLFCYHLRERDDDNGFATLEKRVSVNHSGSVITAEEIDFGGQDHIALDEVTEPHFLDEQMTIKQFLYGDLEEAYFVEENGEDTDFEEEQVLC